MASRGGGRPKSSAKKPRLTGAERNRQLKEDKRKEEAAKCATLFSSVGKTPLNVKSGTAEEAIVIVDDAKSSGSGHTEQIVELVPSSDEIAPIDDESIDVTSMNDESESLPSSAQTLSKSVVIDHNIDETELQGDGILSQSDVTQTTSDGSGSLSDGTVTVQISDDIETVMPRGSIDISSGPGVSNERDLLGVAMEIEMGTTEGEDVEAKLPMPMCGVERSNLLDKYLALKQVTDLDKKNLIRNGPYHPRNLPSKISHIMSYYSETMSVGNVKTSRCRSWLGLSLQTNKAFCVTCLAFSRPTDGNVLKDGFEDWHNLSRTIKNHEKSVSHKAASRGMTRIMCNKGIENIIVAQNETALNLRRADALLWHQYMKRVIDTIRILTCEGLAFRGHEERQFYVGYKACPMYQPGAGKFLNFINLLAGYDELLRTKLAEFRKNHDYSDKAHKGRGSRVTCLSNDSLRKLIAIMAKMVRERIAEEVSQSGFFSLSSDGTTDITLREQMVVVLRYLTSTGVRERMLDLHDMDSTKGVAVAKQIVTSLKSQGIDPNRCVGISFDGAANMQGRENGAAALLKPDMPMAVNVYCAAHGSNLVDKAVCRSSVVAVNLYGTDNETGDLQTLRTFLYGNARKRNEVLQRHKEPYQKAKKLELAETHSVRFTAAQLATDRLLMLYKPVLKSLKEISGSPTVFEPTVRAKASGLLNRFQKFETVLTLKMFSSIFSILNPLNKLLQSEGIELSTVVSSVDLAVKKLQELRDSGADGIFKEAENLADKYELDEKKLPEIRVSRAKRKSPSEGEDERLAEPRRRWMAETFYPAVDVSLWKLKEKFQDQRALLNSLSAFLPSFMHQIQNTSEEVLEDKVVAYCGLLEMDSSEIASQLREVAELIEESGSLPDLKAKNTFSCVYNYLVDNHVTDAYPELTLIYQILSTIPTTSSECERLFSKMKIIKNRLTNTMESDYLSDRLIIAAEWDLAWMLPYEDIIQKFADTEELRSIFYP